MEHEMILFSADLKTVHARLAAKRKAPLVEQEQHHTRNVEDAVQGRDGAPQEPEAA